MRNAEARITLAVMAERAGDHATAVAHAHAALQSGRKSLPSLEMVARELIREFKTAGHLDDPDVQDFVQAVADASIR